MSARRNRRRQVRMAMLLNPPMPGPQVRYTAQEHRVRAQEKFEAAGWGTLLSKVLFKAHTRWGGGR